MSSFFISILLLTLGFMGLLNKDEKYIKISLCLIFLSLIVAPFWFSILMSFVGYVLYKQEKHKVDTFIKKIISKWIS